MESPSRSPTAGGDSLAMPHLSRIPPHAFFLISAVFHYLGPACAVLLFARLDPLGVAWLRIATATIIFMLWRRPWRAFIALAPSECYIVVALGSVLATMNMSFYLAISRLPLGTVGAIEYLGPIVLAATGIRHWRNLAALALATLGVYLLTNLNLVRDPVGYFFAFANCGLFILYIVSGHRIAATSSGAIDRLALAMLVAMIVSLPIGFGDARPAFGSLPLFVAAVGVGIASSVIPYVCDQLAMSRMPRASFALFLALLPAFASIIGILVLRQIPSPVEVGGIALVIAGVALHRPQP